MRRLIGAILLLLLAACTHVADAQKQSGVDLRVITYNIRLDLASDGPNAWPRRKEMVADLLKRERPDILGLQEVLLHQKGDLEAALTGYDFDGVGRDDGAASGEFSPLSWRRDRFERIGGGTFWLSPTPDRPSKGWDAAYPRIATWATLRVLASGRTIHVLNTHFDHVGTEARASSGRMIADWARRHTERGEPVIVIGDFNAAPDDPAIAALVGEGRSGLKDSRTSSRQAPYGPPGTFNAFRIDSDAAAPIDHIFVSKDLAVARYAVVTQHWGGRLPSDHYPVVVDIEIAR